MAKFTIRIELHEVNNRKPGQQEYAKLHEAMQEHGFRRTILGDNGITYHMPSAEYNLIDDMNVIEVRDRALGIAINVWESVCVLVTEGQRAWYLKPV